MENLIKSIVCITFLLIPLLFMSVNMNAQVKKNSKLLGLDVSFAAGKTQDKVDGLNEGAAQRASAFNFGFQGGYFITNKLMIGLALCIDTRTAERKTVYSNLNVGPLCRYYVPLKGNLYLFGETSIAYNSFLLPGYTVDYNMNGFSLNAGAGISMLLNKHIALESRIIYSNSSYRTDIYGRDYTIKDNAFGMRIGITTYLD